jgi:hypothetical protein
MATLDYYTFSKRHKSTAQPTGGSQIDVQLKDGTSLISPVFLLSWSGRPTFNYVGFEGRYYFVNDIRSIRNDLWEIECEEDYLGTHKAAIGSTEAMILYASGGATDIIDTRIPTKSGVTISSNSASITGFTIYDDRIASIILSITGTGSFGTYLMKYAGDLPNLMRNITLYTAGSITDLVTGLQQLTSGGSIGDNLKAAIGLPIAFTGTQVCTSGIASLLYLGEYPCTDANNNPIEGYLIDKPIVKGFAEIDIPWTNSGWLKHSPYTELYLYIPLIGTMRLPVDDLINDTKVEVDYSVNVTSGDISAVIYGMQSGKFISTASGNCAMATPYGSSNISMSKVTSAVITGAGGIGAALAISNPVGAAIALGTGLAASASQLIAANQGESYGGGGLGGGSSQGLSPNVRLTSVSKSLTDSQANIDPVLGKPLMRKATISSYSGFIQTDGMQVNAAILDVERETINSLCDGGFYYE